MPAKRMRHPVVALGPEHSSETEALQTLYTQYFVAPPEQEPAGDFEQVSLYDLSIRTYSSDSTTAGLRDDRAELESAS